MELQEVIRSNNTCRYYRKEAVPDAVLVKAISAARFAPNGGNRQPVRFVAVRDPGVKETLRDLYLPYWNAYMKAAGGGEIRVGILPKAARDADHFANHMHEIPVLMMVCARLEDVHPTDHELGRLSVVGGASIYPAVQNFLLGCREQGLGTALTTLLCHEEPRIKALLSIPEDISVAATIAVGYPEKPFPKKLSRRPVSEIAFADRYGNAMSASGDDA